MNVFSIKVCISWGTKMKSQRGNLTKYSVNSEIYVHLAVRPFAVHQDSRLLTAWLCGLNQYNWFFEHHTPIQCTQLQLRDNLETDPTMAQKNEWKVWGRERKCVSVCKREFGKNTKQAEKGMAFPHVQLLSRLQRVLYRTAGRLWQRRILWLLRKQRRIWL